MTSSVVLAVTGLAKEARLAAGSGIAVVGTGGDPVRLRHLLGTRGPASCRAVVSIGIAGGLDPNLRPGDTIVASAVIADECRYEADKPVAARLIERLKVSQSEGRGPRVLAADLAGVDEAVLSIAGKEALRTRTGAAAVDMESHVAADFAARHGFPFAAIRVVCDPAGRALPGFVAHALKPNGEPDIVAVLSALARRDVTLSGLLRLARDSRAAFSELNRCRRRLGDGLGIP